MNLNYLASVACQSIYPKVSIDIYTYANQTNVMGNVTVTYNLPFTILANVQLANLQKLTYFQKLKEINGYSVTNIYKVFWINNSSLTGLNRNLSTGGDYIIYNKLKYKIVGIENQFNTNWVMLLAIESVINE